MSRAWCYGPWIVSGSNDKTLRVWDAPTGTEARTLNEHTREVTSVVFSQNGRLIVSGSKDGTLKVWDATRLLPQEEFERLLGVTRDELPNLAVVLDLCSRKVVGWARP